MEGQCRERWGECGAEILVVTGGRSRVFLLRIGERPRRDVGLSERNPGERWLKMQPGEGTRDTVRFLSSSGGGAVGWSADRRKEGEGVMPPVASSLGGGELGTMSP